MREAHLRALESAEAAAAQARQTAELAAKRAAVTAEAAARKLKEVDLEKVKEDISVRARAAADAAAEKVRRSLPLPFLCKIHHQYRCAVGSLFLFPPIYPPKKFLICLPLLACCLLLANAVLRMT